MTETASHPLDSPRRLRNWLIIFLLVGTAIRLIRYSLAMPIWGDEAFVGVNILDRTYHGLLAPLSYGQVAPIGFLWSQRALYRLIGMSEYAMRLLPTLAGTAALFVFAYWARLLANPLAVAISVGILAVGNYPISRCVELKPYAGDLLASTLLLLVATCYLLDHRRRWLAILAVVLPITIFMSYPAVFTAAAISLVLLLTYRTGPRRNIPLILTVCLSAAASVLLIVLPVSIAQYKVAGPKMAEYWQQGFPPKTFLGFIWWLIKAHTGNLFAYPYGGKNGASTLNSLLVIMGLVVLCRTRPRSIAGLLLLPFAFTLLAAILRRYPYGEAERISQHLAPAAILLIGMGTAAVLQKIASPNRRRWTERFVFVALLLLGTGMTIRTLLFPYSSLDVLAARQETRKLLAEAGLTGTIAVLQPREQVEAIFLWYLHGGQSHIVFDATNDRSWITPGPLWVVNVHADANLESRLTEDLGRPPATHTIHQILLGPRNAAPDYWEVFSFPPRR